MPFPVIPAIAAGLGLAGNIFGAKEDQRNQANVAAANAANGRNAFNLNLYNTQAALGPRNERERTLDPVRNNLLSDLIGRHFSGVDPGVLSSLRAAGPRPGLPEAPEFTAADYKTPGFLDSFFSQGFPLATDIAVAALQGSPAPAGATGGGAAAGLPAFRPASDLSRFISYKRPANALEDEERG